MENIKKKKRFRALKKFKNLHWTVKLTLSGFFLFFLIEAIIQVFPFLWVINNALKTTNEYYDSAMAITRTWKIANFAKVFTEFKVDGTIGYLTMFWNSTWQTFVYLFVNLFSSMFIAYALAKFRFPGRGLLYGIMIFTQTIPIVGTGAAGYKLRYQWGMVNNPWTMWLSWAVGFDYSAFILYGTFQGVSNSYAESAEIDGANEFDILFKIIFPQIVPAMLALMVTNFVARWNDYTTSQIYLNKYPTLAYGMFLFQKESSYMSDGKGIYFASLIMTAIPGVLMYACFQGLIINNISVGGLKG